MYGRTNYECTRKFIFIEQDGQGLMKIKAIKTTKNPPNFDWPKKFNVNFSGKAENLSEYL